MSEIKGVEIFSVGKWNGDDFTVEDIDAMVDSFNENKATLRPFLKLGHNEQQKILANDGLPAAGWVDNLRRVGEKLVADFVQVPKQVMELIQKGAYKKVSSEIYFNIKLGDKLFSRFLSGVALLGTDLPAVTNLKDILSLYGIKDYQCVNNYVESKNDVIVKQYQWGSEKMSEKSQKTEGEIRAELELAETKAKLAKLESDKSNFSDQSKEIDKLKADAKEQEDKLVAANIAIKAEKTEKFCLELEKENLVSKAMIPFVKAIVGDDKKTYSIDKEDYSKENLLKEILKLHSATDVNLEESSEAGERNSKSEGVVDAKINKYAKENDCSYSDAYVSVTAEQE
jgi:hypothetical protein